jgi:hypothetical protein
VDYRPWLKLTKQTLQHLSIGNIALNELVPRVPPNAFQTPQIPGIGKLIQVDYGRSFDVDPLAHKIRAYKTRSSSNHYGRIHG